MICSMFDYIHHAITNSNDCNLLFISCTELQTTDVQEFGNSWTIDPSNCDPIVPVDNACNATSPEYLLATQACQIISEPQGTNNHRTFPWLFSCNIRQSICIWSVWLEQCVTETKPIHLFNIDWMQNNFRKTAMKVWANLYISYSKCLSFWSFRCLKDSLLWTLRSSTPSLCAWYIYEDIFIDFVH